MASRKDGYDERAGGRERDGLLVKVPAFQRFIAFIWFFLLSVPLTLFVLGLLYQLWAFAQGDGLLLDPWNSVVIIVFGLMLLPVFFYLGWYFQARVKNKHFMLSQALGGHFLSYCRAVYGALAGIAIILTIIGILGSVFVDSSLILVSLIGTAFVGIGIISWLLQRFDGEHGVGHGQTVNLKTTGVVLVLFSFVWLYVCAVSLIRRDWVQLEGGVVLFLAFLLLGMAVFRLADRRLHTRSRSGRIEDNDLSE